MLNVDFISGCWYTGCIVNMVTFETVTTQNLGKLKICNLTREGEWFVWYQNVQIQTKCHEEKVKITILPN